MSNYNYNVINYLDNSELEMRTNNLRDVYYGLRQGQLFNQESIVVNGFTGEVLFTNHNVPEPYWEPDFAYMIIGVQQCIEANQSAEEYIKVKW